MIPTRLLISGRLCTAVADQLAGRVPDLAVRARERPTSLDLAWADAYSGFDWPAQGHDASFAWVHAMGAGVDAFAPHSQSIGLLTRTIGAMPERMGRFVLSVLLERMHGLVEYADAQRAHDWCPREPSPLPSRAVVLGTGAIASGIAEALARCGISVTGVNRSGRASRAFERTVPWSEVHGVLSGCPLLVIALPASDTTEGIVGRTVLAELRSALLINVGRGSTLDLDALRAAFDRGSVAAAHLDVFDSEPLHRDSWLWAHPGVRLTPHVAALTTTDEAADAILTTYHDLLAGRSPALLVTERG